jgi:M6 family metalloprotease-like protein
LKVIAVFVVLILVSIIIVPSTIVLQPTNAAVLTDSLGEIKAGFVQMQFPDHHHNTYPYYPNTSQTLSSMDDYFREASFGRAWLSFTQTGWLMMPKNWSYYQNNREELNVAVIQAADPYIDYNTCSHLFVLSGVGWDNETMGGPACAFQETTLTSEGNKTIHLGFDTEGSFLPAGYNKHEFLHTFDLPDLYYYQYPEQMPPASPVGRWSLMDQGAAVGMSPDYPNNTIYVDYGYRACCNHLDAWSKIQLGWITQSEILTLHQGDNINVKIDGTEIATTGYHALKIPLDNASYYLVEVRKKIGYDSTLPSEGVLITLCNDRLSAPYVRVIDANSSANYLFDAAYKVNGIYQDTNANLTIRVASMEGNSYTVNALYKVTAPLPTPIPAPIPETPSFAVLMVILTFGALFVITIQLLFKKKH